MAQKKKSTLEKTAKKKAQPQRLEHWKNEPDEHDYPAALDYLTLLLSLEAAEVKAGKSLSPVLLVRGLLESDLPLTIADGYHRICASYWLDENADIPCRLV